MQWWPAAAVKRSQRLEEAMPIGVGVTVQRWRRDLSRSKGGDQGRSSRGEQVDCRSRRKGRRSKRGQRKKSGGGAQMRTTAGCGEEGRRGGGALWWSGEVAEEGVGGAERRIWWRRESGRQRIWKSSSRMWRRRRRACGGRRRRKREAAVGSWCGGVPEGEQGGAVDGAWWRDGSGGLRRKREVVERDGTVEEQRGRTAGGEGGKGWLRGEEMVVALVAVGESGQPSPAPEKRKGEESKERGEEEKKWPAQVESDCC